MTGAIDHSSISGDTVNLNYCFESAQPKGSDALAQRGEDKSPSYNAVRL